MPNPRPLSSLRGGYDDPPASESSTPRTRRSHLQRALQSTTELAREVASMVEAEQRFTRPSASNTRRRQRSPSIDREGSQDNAADGSRSARLKRRRLEPSRTPAPRPAIKYGHYGQVEPGKLKLELVSCDGGEHVDARHPQTYLGPKNLLRHDKSVYCSERPTTNILLRHADDSPFCLEKLHIVGPESGFTAPVREGIAYIAMSLVDLRKYIDPPIHARRSASHFAPRVPPPRAQSNSLRHIHLSPEPLSLMDALIDPEINAALDTMRREYDRPAEQYRRRGENLDELLHYSDDPSSAYVDFDPQCDIPPSDEGESWPSEDGIDPVTLLSDEETGPEDSTPQEVIDFLQHRHRLMRRRYEIENWDREDEQWNHVSGFAAENDDDQSSNQQNVTRLEAIMTRSRVYDSSRPNLQPRNNDINDNTPPDGGQSAESEPAEDPNVTCARFQIRHGRHKVAIKFVPEVSGRYVLIKLWAGRSNVDVQSIIAKGYGGLRFFPAVSLTSGWSPPFSQTRFCFCVYQVKPSDSSKSKQIRRFASNSLPLTFPFLVFECLLASDDSCNPILRKWRRIVDVSKIGSFPSNLLLGRPYYTTYEIVEKCDGEAYSRLRIVPPLELNADVIAEESETGGVSAAPRKNDAASSEAYDIVAEDGTVIAKNNRLTIDDASRQALSQQDIEELKKTAGGREIIEKILANHAGLDEKTAFSKAKYMVRKSKKYLKRFEVLPMSIRYLMEYISDKEPQRILDIREEALGLVMAWSNAHVTLKEWWDGVLPKEGNIGGRWLTVDDTGGLVVAALAERMNLLYGTEADAEEETPTNDTDGAEQQQDDAMEVDETEQPKTEDGESKQRQRIKHRDYPTPALTNTITLLHPAVQPNISLLKYFGYDSNIPDQIHPLHTHLKCLSWLQLLHPEEDPTYTEPDEAPAAELESWKSGKRGAYFKKRRRRARCEAIVNETRAGGFEGLVIASHMDPASILPHAVSLIRGGGHIVIYSPNVEPLVTIMDLYSKERRSAYIQQIARGAEPNKDDFPVDPRLLLAPTLQTSRVRESQVLPGRTHPMMTSKGGVEGFVFTARKVIPLEGGVEARGNHGGKKRKVGGEEKAE
ncbi:Hypothetical protein R9X50_00356500 [Acrodontium crateriforme]|uniref:tRNA (adenine(58)-N(1))-methyltransferase non-catalytic subunit TRM6 n=1 Tax=Acrodontium crateriforme TaxID=150365 RepID=A0AAQ3R9Z6_9PEZI|nr:Hypothetical protein R9X50_00356500 [Acrodontium crateriforme]